MTGEERQRMNALCAQIQKEKNYEKFQALTRELSDLVARKERRFLEHKFLVSPAKGWKLLHAIAQRVIGPQLPDNVEKVQINVSEADDLFCEIRVENSFFGPTGTQLAIKQGADLEVRLEASMANLQEKPSQAA